MPQMTRLATLTFCIGSIHGGSDFPHASLAAPWKVPTFVKGGRRCLSSPMSVSSFLLQVRGGSDRDPSGFYDDDDNIKRAKSDRYSPPEYDYREEKRNDDYYSQDGNYYEDDRRYDRDYDDRGAKRTPSVRAFRSLHNLAHAQTSDSIY